MSLCEEQNLHFVTLFSFFIMYFSFFFVLLCLRTRTNFFTSKRQNGEKGKEIRIVKITDFYDSWLNIDSVWSRLYARGNLRFGFYVFFRGRILCFGQIERNFFLSLSCNTLHKPTHCKTIVVRFICQDLYSKNGTLDYSTYAHKS